MRPQLCLWGGQPPTCLAGNPKPKVFLESDGPMLVMLREARLQQFMVRAMVWVVKTEEPMSRGFYPDRPNVWT